MTAFADCHGLISPPLQTNRNKMRIATKYVVFLTGLLMLAVISSANAQFFSKQDNPLLPEEEAFALVAEVQNGILKINWSIADDYYMYREQFSVASASAGVQIGDIQIAQGVLEDDPEFGQVEVYFYNAEISSPISAAAETKTIDLIIKGQGCNKPVGVCYPPQARTLSVDYHGAATAVAEQAKRPAAAEKSFWAYVLTALGAGILLSFTPCVLPMIPILAGLIAGQHKPSKLRSGWLAICYVAGTIVTYAIAGWVAGKSGTQLQAYFQNPWVISFICALLLLLAASLFGAFRIQLPNALQSRLNQTSVLSGSASLSSFALGLISALVVGACVSPILIVTLGAAISKGDPVLGAAIMASMALGMGLLLILFGFGAGWLLPKSGAWMKEIQVLFGFMVIGVAIYIAGTIAALPILYFWAGLLFVTGLYLWQITQGFLNPLLQASLRSVSLVLIVWGAMALIGGSSGGDDVLRPISTIGLSSGSSAASKAPLPFQSTSNLTEAKKLLEKAKLANRPTMVDFYADWCLDCRRMHRTTYKQDSVAAALKDWHLIEIDVTNTSDQSEELKRFFDVFGPPATLFIGRDGNEISELRQYGYLSEEDFLTFIRRSEQ
jgi:thiol:disulfide interchange protein DsbD